jgi:hypothetical protein
MQTARGEAKRRIETDPNRSFDQSGKCLTPFTDIIPHPSGHCYAPAPGAGPAMMNQETSFPYE